MALDLKTIIVDEESEIAHLLDGIDELVFVLDRRGVQFIVTRIDHPRVVQDMCVVEDEDIWRDYDPEKIRTALDEVAGTLSDADADAMIAAIYRGRDEGTRPPPDA